MNAKILLVLVTVLAWPALRTSAQSIAVSTVGETLRIRATGFTFLRGEPLARLKDGRAVRIELALTILAEAGRSPVTERRQIFSISYDLWEERFAVTAGTPPESMSHLTTTTAAETWCIDRLTIPLQALGVWGRDRPFWIRLEYRILDGSAASDRDEGEGFTLQALIDRLSRRRKPDAPAPALEAGPFRLPPRGVSPAPR